MSELPLGGATERDRDQPRLLSSDRPDSRPTLLPREDSRPLLVPLSAILPPSMCVAICLLPSSMTFLNCLSGAADINLIGCAGVSTGGPAFADLVHSCIPFFVDAEGGGEPGGEGDLSCAARADALRASASVSEKALLEKEETSVPPLPSAEASRSCFDLSNDLSPFVSKEALLAVP